MLISVIVPACNAHETIGRALATVPASVQEAAVEVVIASDDGSDYSECHAQHDRVVLVPPGPVRSGPGPARNRALRAASGTMIAFLDADDTWSPGYLERLLPEVESHGAAFAPSRVLTRDGELLLRIPDDERTNVDFEVFGEFGGSLHPVARREHVGAFRDLPAQDVLHALEVLSAVGGRCPLAPEVGYEIRLGSESVTQAADFGARVRRAYGTYAREVAAGASRVLPEHRERVRDALAQRLELDAGFTRARDREPGLGFYAWVARQRSR